MQITSHKIKLKNYECMFILLSDEETERKKRKKAATANKALIVNVKHISMFKSTFREILNETSTET